MLLDSNVRIFRDGTISFSRELCVKSGLREGTTLSVFYSRPGNFLFLKPLGERGGGVIVSRNDRGAMVAGQAVDFLEQFGLLKHKKTYGAHWNPTRRRIVVWLNLRVGRTAMRLGSGPDGLHELAA